MKLIVMKMFDLGRYIINTLNSLSVLYDKPNCYWNMQLKIFRNTVCVTCQSVFN